MHGTEDVNSVELGDHAKAAAELIADNYGLKKMQSYNNAEVYQRTGRNKVGFLTRQEDKIIFDRSTYDEDEIAEVLEEHAKDLAEQSNSLFDAAQALEEE